MIVLRAVERIARPAPSPDDLLFQRIAAHAVDALLLELATWPKPGLVSYVDTGSHHDMDAAMLRGSALVLRPFFAELVFAGWQLAGMNRLRTIGLRAEAAMLRFTCGVNTHRGAIFGLGLLCAAAGASARLAGRGGASAPRCLGRCAARRWGDEIRRGPVPLHSHGSAALRHYGAGGARAEAADGFPSIYDIGLPALRVGRAAASGASEPARVQACFALIAAVRDTNLLHRGGAEGARFASEAATSFLASGGVAAPDWHARASAVHADFVRRRLSPGGCADLLAMTLSMLAL